MKKRLTSPLFEDVGVWLIDRGLREASVDEILQGFGRKLVEGGAAPNRIALGGILLHPVLGALDAVWNARDDNVTIEMMPRNGVTSTEFRNSPFYWAAAEQIAFHRFRLDAGPVDPEFPIFSRLRTEGVTDYLLFFETYGRTDQNLWGDLPPGMEGVMMAVSTHRIGGFSEIEVDYIRALMRPLSLSIKASKTHLLARELLDTYVGSYSGSQVLSGAVERGDGRTIDCILFYCDLRGSTRLAEQLPIDRYLALINSYFDCTAGAVADHGGEILKFIGDAVMAIFPIEPKTRPAVDMCRVAVAAACEAFRRAERVNADLNERNDSIRFGIALHRGQVMYGNVGTDQRLDFTTIGQAVNQVTRLESLCKTLSTSFVTSKEFEAEYSGDLVSLGSHRIGGTERSIEVFTLPGAASDESIPQQM